MSASTFRVCMLSDDFLPAATGVGTHLQTIVPMLIERGHEVCVVTTRRKGERDRESWNGAMVYRVATLPVFGFYQAIPTPRALGRILADFNPDIIHCHYLGYLLIQALRYAERRAIPKIYTYHMTVDHLTQPWPMRPWRPLLERLYIHYCNRFDRILVPSAQLASDVRSQGVRPPVEFLSNPLPFAEIDEVNPATKSGFVVLFVGRLNPEKNVSLLLNAFARFSADHPDAQLWIAGHGSSRRDLENEAVRLDIAGRVRFLGFLSHQELPSVYSACDVFVLPSTVETQGLVAIEAMHFGKPVIVTSSIVSARELVDEGVNGFIVSPDDPVQMANRLAQLAGDQDLRDNLGASGEKRAAQYTPATVLEKLEGHYRALFDR